MELKNGYVVLYNAPERITAEKQGPVYGAKGIPVDTDAMLISTNNNDEYVDLRSFKLIYSDGTHLLGSVSGIPADTDVNILIKAGTPTGELVFGEKIVVATPVVAKVAKKSAKAEKAEEAE